MFALISPFSKSFDENGFTYFIPNSLKKEIKIGQIVEIPFGNEKTIGVVLKIEENSSLQSENIKEISSIYNENIFILNYEIDLVFFISSHYFSKIHNSLNLFFPKNLKEKINKKKLDFEKTSNYNYLYNFSLELSKNQEKALEKMLEEKEKKILFYGITGSGKTEIYIKLIKKYLEEGKQSLLLIPEIILGNQTLEKIKNVFGKDVIIINSTISEAQKTKYFLDIYHNKAKIILGTRSALFYPYNNLGLIILDEEHDNSYISDQSPRYNSCEIAEKISDLTNCKIVLASGTPSINSMYKGLKGNYKIVSLLEKYIKD